MPQQKNDRVQREIEELLDQLDTFVPEERFLSKVKSRRKKEAGPSAASKTWAAVTRPFRRITLGHVMIAGLALVVTAWLLPRLGIARWVLAHGGGLHHVIPRMGRAPHDRWRPPRREALARPANDLRRAERQPRVELVPPARAQVVRCAIQDQPSPPS
jgi:hypothetical protein